MYFVALFNKFKQDNFFFFLLACSVSFFCHIRSFVPILRFSVFPYLLLLTNLSLPFRLILMFVNDLTREASFSRFCFKKKVSKKKTSAKQKTNREKESWITEQYFNEIHVNWKSVWMVLAKLKMVSEFEWIPSPFIYQNIR